MFQVKLELCFEHGFVCRPNRRGEDSTDDDQRVLALMFRDHMEWAVGHNTSVDIPEVVDGKVTRLRTTQIPRFVVPAVEHRSFDDLTTGMADLAKLDQKTLATRLSRILTHYDAWIAEQAAVLLDRKALRETRDGLVERAKQIRSRIAEGIALLEGNQQAF